MLADEPDLQFIGTEDITDRQVVGTVVAKFISSLSKFPAFADNDLVGVQEA